MNTTLRTTVAALLAIAGISGSAQAAPIIIDTFLSPTQSLTAGPGGPNPTNRVVFGTNSSILGGERDMTLLRTNGSGRVSANVGITYTNGGVIFSSPSDTIGSLMLMYDGIDGSANTNFSLLNVDLTDSGSNDRFHLRGGADIANGQFVVTVYSSATNFSRYAATVPTNTLDPSLFTDFYFLFTDMTPTGGGANFGQVRAIALELNGLNAPSVDLVLSVFEVIPEMSVSWVLGVLPVIALLRHRLARQKR